MLYLLRPNLPLLWNGDIPWKMALQAAEQGADLARLEWRDDTDQLLDSYKIRVAIRHGIASLNGIVIEGLTLRAGGDGDTLRTLSMQAQESQRELRENDRLMEHLIPGWRAHGEELDSRIASDAEKEARSRDEKAVALLEAEVNPDLVSLWERLGGDLPDPI